VKESTDSSTTLEDDDIKGKQMVVVPFFHNSYPFTLKSL
jgi:hypothetical protein